MRNPKRRLGAQNYDDIKNHKFFESIDWKKLEQRNVLPPLILNMDDDDDESLPENNEEAQFLKEKEHKFTDKDYN